MAGTEFFTTSAYYYGIDTIFNNHTRELEQKIWEAEGEITTWARTLHFQIDEHVKEQKQFLRQCYDEQQFVLKARKNEFIDTAWKYYDRNDYQQINELLRQCKNLKFELLIAFDYEDRSLPFIKYMTKEQLEQKQKQAFTTRNNRLEPQSSSKDHRDTDKARDPHIDSSYNSTHASGQQINGSSSTSKSAIAQDRSPSGNASQNDQATGGNISEGKCLVCFMIYPPTMEEHDRRRHVLEHFNDN